MTNFARRTARIRRRRQSSSKLPFKLLIILTSFILLRLIHQQFFVVKQITCQTNHQLGCPDSLNSYLEQYQGHSLLTLSQKTIKDFIQSTYSSLDTDITIALPGKLTIITDLQPSLTLNTFLVTDLPDFFTQSTISAEFKSPYSKINTFISTQSSQLFDLSPSGELISPTSDQPTKLNLIFKQKPDPQSLSNLFQVLNQIDLFFSYQKAFILNDNLFLRPDRLPDIIIPITGSMDKLNQALQSIDALAKIKPDTSLIDLRFNQPVIH